MDKGVERVQRLANAFGHRCAKRQRLMLFVVVIVALLFGALSYGLYQPSIYAVTRDDQIVIIAKPRRICRYPVDLALIIIVVVNQKITPFAIKCIYTKTYDSE